MIFLCDGSVVMVNGAGMYKGDDPPADINDAVSTMMGTGKAQGELQSCQP